MLPVINISWSNKSAHYHDQWAIDHGAVEKTDMVRIEATKGQQLVGAADG